AACRMLVDRLASRVEPNRERTDEIAAARATARQLIDALQPQAAYLAAIRDVLPRDGFLVPEVSQVGFATYTGAWPVLAPRTYVTEGFQGTLGFGFPTALGVKAAHPTRAVVSVTGDGGFMFGMQELATAAEYELGVVTLLFNNDAFGNVLRDQLTLFDGRVIGAKRRNPDFVALAESFGVAACRVSSPAELRPKLERALADGMPALIEIRTDPSRERTPWPLIHMCRKQSMYACRLPGRRVAVDQNSTHVACGVLCS